ncbi:MAG TPA: ATP-binding SpoIIE family protein phosphatase [Isosphaeraceae bacterium]|nr:ATP-binding SpoIIE family protein phosphatase [Isosphaeraceae bacterium]
MINPHGESIGVIVDETTKVGEARRRTSWLAGQLGFDDTAQGKAALIVTEVANNLLKHAGGGELIIQGLDDDSHGEGLEIFALDSGRGINDVGQCLADGYSTAGSPGTGLGAINRLVDSLQIYSNPGLGTVLWARVNRTPQPKSRSEPTLELGVVERAAPGEQLCGDGWATNVRDGRTFVLMVDGLGHGSAAAQAAAEAVRVFRGHRAQEPNQIVESAHLALRGTRGAALAIARLDPVRREVRYAGVGNISGVILDTTTGTSTSMVSQNGTVGYTIRKIQTYEYPWNNDSLLLMHSDGVATQWSLDRYPGLRQRHPSLIAGALYRDYKRARDDITVLAARLWTRGKS